MFLKKILLLGALVLAPFAAHAAAAAADDPVSSYECALSNHSVNGLNPCQSSPVADDSDANYQAVIGNTDPKNISCTDRTLCGVRSDSASNAPAPIDAWNICRWVDNADSANSYFVPFRTGTEWTNFLGSPPLHVTVSGCAVPSTVPVTITPGSNCSNPQPASYTVTPSFYGRAGTKVVSAYKFTCTVYGQCGTGTPTCGADQKWTQTATGGVVASTSLLKAPNSQYPYTDNYPWTPVTTTYSGDPPPANPAPVNGACGSGQSAGQYNCNHGIAISKIESGATSTWVCSGEYGGANSGTCSDTDGTCGTGQYACSTGTPTGKNDNGSQSTWQCAGSNGGKMSNVCAICDTGYSLVASSCVPIVNGNCGSTQYACTTGTPVQQNDNGGTSTWTCDGMNGGANSAICKACDAGYTWNGTACALSVNGSCGSQGGQCQTGTVGSQSNANGTYAWSCNGINGGSTASCTQCDNGYAWNGSACAPVINGACGSASNSCTTGAPEALNSFGNYSTWTCQGSNGGSNSGQCMTCNAGYVLNGTSCVQTINGVCGNGQFACVSGTPDNDTSTPGGSYAWLCTGSGGGSTASCSLNAPVNGACGTSINTCATGSATQITANNTGSTWYCEGTNGGTTSSQCSYTQPPSGQCGAPYVPQIIQDNGYPNITTEQGQQMMASAFWYPISPMEMFPAGGFGTITNLGQQGTVYYGYISPICASGTASSVSSAGGHFTWSCGGTQCQIMPSMCNTNNISNGVPACDYGGTVSNFALCGTLYHAPQNKYDVYPYCNQSGTTVYTWTCTSPSGAAQSCSDTENTGGGTM